MKLNRNFPHAVYRGTPCYGGLGIVSLTTHQAYKQIQLLIGSIRNGDSGGDLALKSLEYLQLEAGTSNSVLSPTPDDNTHNWLTTTWLTSVQRALLECEVQIKVTNEWIPQTQRTNDTYIMEEFAKKYANPRLLRQLNRCRIYLQAITLADITDSTG